MQVKAFDHIVLTVKDVFRACQFYERALGMEPREERPGKWSLHFGSSKISLQEIGSVPEMARRTAPGSGNFCLLTDVSISKVAQHLIGLGIEVLAGPDERAGATGPILSIYFNDPDGNLVEISNLL
jgi:catechol 2,3-dioxygenase-like lactoylglutathione lyase family enzyme